jgi:exonuclease III
VSVVEIPSLKLVLFNIYAVNGTDNPYRDSSTEVVTGTRHDRKLAFHKLLMEDCQRRERDGRSVVLGGDMNVAPAPIDGYPRLRTFPYQHVLNRTDFNRKFMDENQKDGFKGIDAWRKMHGERRGYSWYARTKDWGSSCDRVDYFIVGKDVWDKEMVKNCGMLESEVERGPSDHVPIWIEIRKHREAEEQ